MKLTANHPVVSAARRVQLCYLQAPWESTPHSEYFEQVKRWETRRQLPHCGSKFPRNLEEMGGLDFLQNRLDEYDPVLRSHLMDE